MKNKLNKIFIFISFLSFPLFAFAQTVKGIFSKLGSIMVDFLIPAVGAVLIAVFIYGVVKFITAAGDGEKRKDAKMFIIVGLVALFFLVAFWALVQVLMNTFFGGMPSMPSGFPPEFFK